MNTEEQLEHLNEIKDIMTRSSRFISLSGLSGITAGIIALLGAVAAFIRLNYSVNSGRRIYDLGGHIILDMHADASWDLFFLALIILVLAIFFGYIFTRRKAKKAGDDLWGRTSMKLLINMMIPLATGGLFCLIMLWHGIYGLVAPATLIFYGLACVNASHHTLNDIRYLGLFNIGLGLLNCFFIGYGLVFWAIGFGIMHIVYGSVMYLKYER